MDCILKNLLQGVLFITLFLLSVSLAHGKEGVAVFQPDLRAPYDSVFQSVIGGIDEAADFKVSIKKIAEDYDTAKLSSWLKKNNIKAIIALGSRGLAAAKEAGGDLPIMAAASLLTPGAEGENVGGISLAADPEFVFAELKRLLPSVRKVCFVYSPKHNDWLVERAAQAADKYGIKLKPVPASDLRQAAIQYKSVLNELESGADALWLPLDPITVENRTILPLILRVTWDRNLTLISSNAPHAKRGALFSTFPKNMEMGQSIANVVNKWLASGQGDFEVKPLMDLGLAINVRTAAHLGIKLSKDELARYDLKFPQN